MTRTGVRRPTGVAQIQRPKRSDHGALLAPLLVVMTTWFAMFAAAMAIATDAHAEAITLAEQRNHVTQAVVTIDATPAEIYQLVTDYARWPSMLSDVRSVRVEQGGRRDGRVRFRSRALENQVTILFDNVPDRLIRFKGIKGPPGGRASGQYRLEPISGPGGIRTRVTASLYLDVVGLPGLFVSDAKIQAMRRLKLERDLTDVVRWFSARKPPRPAA